MAEKVWEDNKNVYTVPRFSEKGRPYIEIVPYDREITPQYAKKIVKKLLKKYDDFVLSSSSIVFDGLSETNALLLRDGCIIQNKYDQSYRTLKAKKKTNKVS